MRQANLVYFLLRVVEKSWEVLKSPVVEDSLGLIICTCHDVAHCPQSRGLHLHFSEIHVTLI